MYKDQVRRFYEVIWDAHDKSAIPSVLHENVVFRGSLGYERIGHEGLAEYVDMIHSAVDDYKCIIEELVEEGEKFLPRCRLRESIAANSWAILRLKSDSRGKDVPCSLSKASEYRIYGCSVI